MKSTLLRISRLCLMTCLLSLTVTTVKAVQSGLSELTYVCINNDTYTFTLHLYRDVCDFPPSPSILLNITGNCFISGVYLTQQTPVDVNLLCQSDQGRACCNGGTLPCYRDYAYTGTIRLDPCSTWRIFYTECCISPDAQNLDPSASYHQYIEARVNNNVIHNNNSVQFSSTPLLITCANIPFTYAPIAFDPDGDSLVFSSITPPTSNTLQITWAPGYSEASPLPGNNFTIDSTTGIINATPTASGRYIMAIKVEEYRNGVLVGTTIRNLEVHILSNCGTQILPPTHPAVSNERIDGNVVNTPPSDNHFSICSGSTLEFDINSSSSSNIHYSTNLDSVTVPGAILNITGNNTSNINCAFSWNTNGVAPGDYYFYVIFEDDACPSRHLVSQVFKITVLSVNISASQNSICVGNTNTIQLNATNWDGAPLLGSFSWSPATGLNNPLTANPVATISEPNRYTLTYNLGHCQLVQGINIIASPFSVNLPEISDNILCATNSVVLYPNAPAQPINPVIIDYITPTLIPRAMGGIPTYTAIPFNVDGVYPAIISSLSDLNVFNSININIQQQTVDHIVISLIAPSGETVILSQNNGGIGNGYVNSTFAYPIPPTAVTVSSFANTPIPSNRLFIPQNGASSWQNLIGAAVNGTWLLYIEHNGVGTTYDGTVLNAQLKLNNSNSLTYVWTPSLDLDNPNIASPIANPITTTNYQLIASSSAGCSDTTEVVVYVQNALPTPVFTTQASVQYPVIFSWEPVPNATSYELSLDGGSSFFSNGNNLIYTPSGLTTGDTANLCVRAVPAAGSGCNPSALSCQSTVLGTCSGLNSTISGNLSLCNNTSTTLLATTSNGVAPYTFLWSTEATSSQITGVLPGTYTLNIVDSNGCSSLDTVVVSYSPALTSSISTTSLTCNNDYSGTATVLPIGGISPYSYHWSDNRLTTHVDHLSAITYTVTITDSQGCTSVNQATPSQPQPLNITTQVTDLVCPYTGTGAISITSCTGGIYPYGYNWSSGSQGANISNLAVGVYQVTVMDASYCTSVFSIPVQSVSPVTISVQTTPSNEFGNGTAIASAQNGYTPYSYTWSNLMTGSEITNLSPGVFTVTVTDRYGCTASATVVIGDISSTTPATSAMPNFEVLPNPNNGIFDIKLEHTDNESVQLDILNINGQLIYHTELNTPHIQLPIDLSQQPSGHYIVKATLGQQVYLKRFIIR